MSARCAHVRAGVGAVASQNVTDPSLGPKMLDLLESGLDAQSALGEIKRTVKFMEYRQILAVDHLGNIAIHSGENSLGIWTQAEGEDVASGGNLLANDQVPTAIISGFTLATGHIGDRLLAAMRAGLDTGARLAQFIRRG